MTEKSARNPTPGSFPHTGSAPAAPPVRGQRGATSAERGAEPRGRGAAAEAPAGLRGGGGPGTGGERPGGARRRPPYDRSWRADRGGARPARRSGRAQPRTAAHSRGTAAQRRRGGRRKRGPAESCGRRRGPERRPPGGRDLGTCLESHLKQDLTPLVPRHVLGSCIDHPGEFGDFGTGRHTETLKSLFSSLLTHRSSAVLAASLQGVFSMDTSTEAAPNNNFVWGHSEWRWHRFIPADKAPGGSRLTGLRARLELPQVLIQSWQFAPRGHNQTRRCSGLHAGSLSPPARVLATLDTRRDALSSDICTDVQENPSLLGFMGTEGNSEF
ncbi:uncharacterized protein GJ701_013889 isoform 1-T1 [Geothlypis trichas]